MQTTTASRFRRRTRRATRGAGLLTATLLVGAGLALGGPQGPQAATAGVPVASARPSCAAVAPSSLTGYRAMWSRFGGTWKAADGGYSVRNPLDGSFLFVFGDTAVTRRDGSRGLPHGSAVAWRGRTLVRASGDTSFVPDARDGSWYWPGTPVVDAGRLYVFAGHDRTSPGGWTPLGTDLAEYRWSACSRPVFRRMLRTPSTSGQGVSWGAGSVTRSGFVYVYGTRRPNGFGCSVSVARVPVGHLAQMGAWRYWDGGRWQADARRSAAVVPPQGGPQSQFEVGYAGARYRFVSKAEGPLGTWVTRWTSSTPVGPWTPTRLFYSPFQPWDQRYLETAHYDLPRIAGRVITSTSHGRACRPDAAGNGCLRTSKGAVPTALADLWEQPQWFRNTYGAVQP